MSSCRSRRILVISHEYPPSVGGAGIVAQATVAAFFALGCEVTLLTKRVAGRKGPGDCTTFETCHLKSFGFIDYFFALKKCDYRAFDLIILNDVGAVVAASYFMDDSALKKSIMWFHGGEVEKIIKATSLKYRLSGLKKKYLRTMDKCKKIVFVSDFLKTKVLHDTDVDISKKSVVIENFIDSDLFYRDQVNLHKQLNISEDRSILLSVGRVVEGKGYGRMLDIFTKISRADSGFHWVVVGDGPYLETLKFLAKQRQLDAEISYVGRVDRSILRNYYSAADVFWSLSDFEESFSFVCFEALACGTPVITRPVGGCPAFFQQGKYAKLVTNDHECAQYVLARDYLSYDKQALQDYARCYSRTRFTGNLQDQLLSTIHGN